MSTDQHEHSDPRVERTRAAILDAARDLLMTDGPDAVTHVHVAAQARVSRTTIYKHYPSRPDLIRATIEHVGTPFPNSLTGDVRADLRAFVDDVVKDLGNDARSRAFITLLERAHHDEEIASVRDGLVCDAQAHFATLVEHGIEQGVLRDDIDVDIAIASVMGTFFFRRFMADEPVDGDLADRVVSNFLECYGVSG